jgi:hypothetical protein
MRYSAACCCVIHDVLSVICWLPGDTRRLSGCPKYGRVYSFVRAHAAISGNVSLVESSNV